MTWMLSCSRWRVTTPQTRRLLLLRSKRLILLLRHNLAPQNRRPVWVAKEPPKAFDAVERLGKETMEMEKGTFFTLVAIYTVL